ncbi:hypothetical protein HDU91_004486, partial [Kappamyces sp. JEL0680]
FSELLPGAGRLALLRALQHCTTSSIQVLEALMELLHECRGLKSPPLSEMCIELAQQSQRLVSALQ